MVDMHTHYPKIKENNEHPKVLSAKQSLTTSEIWSTKGFSSIATILSGLKSEQGVLPSGLKTFPYHLESMQNLASKIREDTTLQT
jgi:hypothetical protein